MTTRRLTRTSYLAYALGSVGTGGFGVVPGLLLLYFLTNVLGVSPGLAGVVVFAPKAWDVIINPYVGRISDRAVARTGTRARFLLVGGSSLPLFFALMFFADASWPPVVIALFVGVMFLLAATAFAVFQVPYIALPAEITDSYQERTTLMSWRIAFLTGTILLLGAGAPALVRLGGGGTAGYRLMGAVAALVIGAGLLAAWLGLRRTPTLLAAAAAEGSLLDQLRLAGHNRVFVLLFIAFVIQALAVGCMLAGVPYLANYVLGDTAATTGLFVTLMAPAIALMPVWALVGRAVGKKAGFLIASCLFMTGAALFVFSRSLPLGVVYGLMGVCGTAYAGLQLFALSMLPDTIDLEEARTGEKRAGVFTGLWTGGETIAMAVGPALYSFVLSLSGFVSSRADEVVEQSQRAVSGVVIGFSAVPALLLLASLPFVLRYRLDAATLAAARDQAPAAPAPAVADARAPAGR